MTVTKKLILIAAALAVSSCESQPDDIFQELGEAATVIVERRTAGQGRLTISYLEGYYDSSHMPAVCGLAGIVDEAGRYSECGSSTHRWRSWSPRTNSFPSPGTHSV